MALLDKLAMIKLRFDDVAQQIIEPEVIADMKRYVKLNKEYKDLMPIVDAFKAYKTVCDNIDESNEILESEDDTEMIEMARMELDEALPKKAEMEESIKVLLIPKDPEDSKNAVVEIRAGAGGDEASIFAGDLYRMYTRYCESKKWRTELVDVTHGTAGGYKEIVMNVTGEDVYGTMKYESGVHRVQRCLLYTSPSPRDLSTSRMPSSA